MGFYDDRQTTYYNPGEYGSRFDPSKATKKDLSVLANHLGEYVTTCDEFMIIPPDLVESEDKIYQALKVVRRLIEKLEKGDKSVFKDYEEWN